MCQNCCISIFVCVCVLKVVFNLLSKYFSLRSFFQFAVLLSLIIIIEIAAAITGYVFRNKVSV